MILNTRTWGIASHDAVICLHGITQHGGIFEPLARRLVDRNYFVIALDLRGHGESGREPPWSIDTHVNDVIETIDGLGIKTPAWLGHSFGGRVAATAAVRSPERVARLALLEPGLDIPADIALKYAEIDRLDWSFATVEGATNALLSNDRMAMVPRDAIVTYVEDDVRRGPDGRFRFRFCPSAAVVAWSEMTRVPPQIAPIPTLLVCAEQSFLDLVAQMRQHKEVLGKLLTAVTVPNGHNVMWESPAETIEAIERFLEDANPVSSSEVV